MDYLRNEGLRDKSAPPAVPALLWVPPSPAKAWMKRPNKSHCRCRVCGRYIDHPWWHNDSGWQGHHACRSLLNHDRRSLRGHHYTCLKCCSGRYYHSKWLFHAGSYVNSFHQIHPFLRLFCVLIHRCQSDPRPCVRPSRCCPDEHLAASPGWTEAVKH